MKVFLNILKIDFQKYLCYKLGEKKIRIDIFRHYFNLYKIYHSKIWISSVIENVTYITRKTWLAYLFLPKSWPKYKEYENQTCFFKLGPSILNHKSDPHLISHGITQIINQWVFLPHCFLYLSSCNVLKHTVTYSKCILKLRWMKVSGSTHCLIIALISLSFTSGINAILDKS